MMGLPYRVELNDDVLVLLDLGKLAMVTQFGIKKRKG